MLESPWAVALLMGALVPLMGARRAHLQAAPTSSGAGALARGGAPLALQLGIALWIAGHAARDMGLPPQLDAWLLGASRLGLVAISPSILLVAWGVARPDARPKAAWIVGLAAVPGLLLVLSVTSGVRDLEPRWGAGPLESASPQELGAWIHLGYATACLVSAFALLAHASARTATHRVRHVFALFAAFGGPLAALLLAHLLELGEVADAAAGGLLATSLAFGWALERKPRSAAPPQMAGEADETTGDAIPTGDAILVVEEAGQLQDVNAAARHLLGIPLDRACGRPVGELLADHPDLLWLIQDPSRSCGEFFTGLTAGTRRCHEVRISSLGSSTRTARIVTIQDVTARREAERDLRHRAHFDSLTGLGNRRFFMDKLTETVASAEKQGHRLALLYMDLDRFKEINDSLGHAAGDELLRILAQRLRQSLDGGEGALDRAGARLHMARFGGDEFAFLVPQVSTPEDAGRVAERVLELTSQSMELSGQSVCCSGSIGIAIHPQDGDDVETLTKHADVALYHAKRLHRSTHQFFSEDMIVNSERKSLIERHLRSAIENDELRLHYQPKVGVDEPLVLGAEALLRWESRELGSVAPKEFIPIAEDSGLIVPIGSWVIDSACRQIRGWLDAGYKPVPVSVNVSSVQLARSNVYATLTECLRYYDLNPNLLEVELTESTLLEDGEGTATCLRDLRAIGVRIALDDFGTGYSALSYLGRFPLDTLKMDRSFVRDIEYDPAAAGIARAVISMAHSLDLEVVAEGVDTEEQVPLLREMGCDQIQGFIYGPAVSRKRFGRYLPKGEQRVQVEIVGSEAECPAPHPDAAAITPPAGVADRDEPAVREVPAALPEKAEVETAEVEEAEIEEEAETEKVDVEPDDRYVLIIDGEIESLGLVALRLNRIGVLSFYARDADEAFLFSMEEAGKIQALLVSPSACPEKVSRIAKRVAEDREGGTCSIIVIGDDVDAAAVERLRGDESAWALSLPVEDSELRYVVNAALALPSEIAVERRPRAPVDLAAWTHIGEVRGHGVLTSLSVQGAFVAMSEPLNVGSRFELEFELAGKPLSVNAKVVYAMPEGAGGRSGDGGGIGVVFFDVRPETEQRLRAAVEERSAGYQG